MTALESTSAMEQLWTAGQSVWLDYIRRDLLESGDMADMVARGLRGMTSNPSIFEKSIAGSDQYDGHIAELAGSSLDAKGLFEAVAIRDIRMAADVLRPVYDEAPGADGFVSLEVSPTLANDTEGTLAEARRLWAAVDRPNLMIKVPATPAGIPAITELIAENINVNVTLMFSLAHYEAVAQAYLAGLDRATEPSTVASVASFFVSRVDSAVDAALEEVGTPEALALRGKIAVANSKAAYLRYQELFGDDFEAIWGKGALPQRLLWASTSTKNPNYSDVMYIEELVGPSTVNTVPPAALEAMEDHGTVRPGALSELAEQAVADLAALAAVGVDLSAITEDLQQAGVASFEDAFVGLLGAIDTKRAALA